MNRRHLISTIPALVVTACAGQTPSQIAQTVVTDAQLIATALTNVLPNLRGVPPAVADKVASLAQQAIGLAQSLVSTMTHAAAQPIIQQIQTDVSAVASAVQPYVRPGSQAAVILADAQALLPVLLLAVGLAAPSGAAPGGADAARTRLVALPKR